MDVVGGRASRTLMNVDGSREREKGVQDDSMVFALSNQANDDEYVLRWEGLRLRRNGKNFVLAK